MERACGVYYFRRVVGSGGVRLAVYGSGDDR